MAETSECDESLVGRLWNWIRPERRAMWIFPAIVLVTALVLTAFGLSGSSTALLGPPGGQQGVVAGESRPVRSDEWLIRTPLVVGQVARGFPRYADVGVGEHDMSVLSDLPVADWPVVFHPQQFGFLVLPVVNGFAFEWWTTSALLLLGAYALLLVLIGDWRWSTAGAVVLWASPFFHWWYYPAMEGSVSWMLVATAAFLSSLNRELGRWNRWWRVGVAAYALSCFALYLYPPSQLPMAAVVSAILLGWLIPKIRSREVHWRTVGLNVLVVGGWVGLIVLAFAVSRSSAIRAIADTVYPGDRRVAGGDGIWGHLVDAWFGWSYISNDRGMRPYLLNESEASSFLFLGLFAIAGSLFAIRAIAGRRSRFRGVGFSLLAVIAFLFIHIFVGWGPIITRLTLFDRVPANRALLGLGVASMLFLVILAKTIACTVIRRQSRMLASLTTMVVGAAGIIWFGLDMRGQGAPISRSTILVVVLVYFIPSALLFWKPFPALVAVAAIGIGLSVPANPLVRGLDPMTNSEFVRVAKALHEVDANGGWVTTDESTASILTASGINSVSGINLYPNADAWRILDPSGASEFVWNRYAHGQWVFEPLLPAPVFTLVQDDFVQIRISPCDPRLSDLGVSFVASSTHLVDTCLRLESNTFVPSGAPVYVYSRGRGPS